MTVEWCKTRVLEVDLAAAASRAGRAGRQGRSAAAGVGERSPDAGAAHRGPGLPPVSPAELAPWLGLAAPTVFSLKQFRHVAATDRACYQSLLRCSLDVGAPIADWTSLAAGAPIVTKAYPELVRSLGIVADAQPVSAAFRASGVPFRFAAIDEPWVART